MSLLRYAVGISLLVALFVTAAPAQEVQQDGGVAPFGYLGVGGSTVDGRTGFTLTGGVGLTFLHWLSLYATPLDMTLVSTDEDSRYQSETVSGGQEICRDTDTGQFAEDSKCTDLLFGGHLGLMFRKTVGKGRQFVIGGGYRFGEGETPFGRVAFRFPFLPRRHWYLAVSAGDNWGELVVGIEIP